MVNQICAFLFVGIHTLEIEGIEKWNDLYAFEALCDTPHSSYHQSVELRLIRLLLGRGLQVYCCQFLDGFGGYAQA